MIKFSVTCYPPGHPQYYNEYSDNCKWVESNGSLVISAHGEIVDMFSPGMNWRVENIAQ